MNQDSTGGAPIVHEVQLPDGLLERLKASNWNERYEAISELEMFVNTHPTAMAPHLHKVTLIVNDLWVV